MRSRAGRSTTSPRASAVPAALPDTAQGWADTLILAATTVILALTLIYCLVSTDGNSFWSADPAVEQAAPLMTFSPSVMAWLNTASVLVAGLALLLHAWLGGRVRWLWVILAAAGVAACAWQAPREVENLTRCSTWVAGVALALAGGHLAQHERARRWIAAAMIAMIIPMALEAAYFVFDEMPTTVRLFREHQDQFLRARGWAPDSDMAQTYIRRLLSPDATGAFGLSNVFGSICAAFTALGAAVGMGLWVRRPRPRNGGAKEGGGRVPRSVAIMVVAAVLLGLAGVVLSRSKGAAVALAMVGGLLGLTWIALRRAALRRWLAPAAFALIAVALLALLARGAMGRPPTYASARSLSLYFRSQYLQGAAAMVREAPGKALLRGLGPAGFAEAYLHDKNPFNPEGITSTHNVLMDNAVMLGAGGIAWSALLLLWLWTAGRQAAADLASPEADAPEAPQEAPLPESGTVVEPGALAPAALLGAALFIPHHIIYLPGMVIEKAVLSLVEAVLFIVVAAVLNSPRWLPRRWLSVGLFAAGTVLLVHSQVEMTFFHYGSSAIAWLVLAAAAGGAGSGAMAAPGSAEGKRGLQRAGLAPGLVLLVVVVPAMERFYREPICARQTLVDRAESLRRDHRPIQTLDTLEAAINLLPRDPQPYRWFTEISLEVAQGYAANGWPNESLAALRRADAVIDRARAAGLQNGSLGRYKAQLNVTAARLTRDARYLGEAEADLRRVIATRPYSMEDRVALGDLLWEQGQVQEARACYRRALELQAQAYLDPLVKLKPEDERRVRQRLRQGSIGTGNPRSTTVRRAFRPSSGFPSTWAVQ